MLAAVKLCFQVSQDFLRQSSCFADNLHTHTHGEQAAGGFQLAL
jgi:hypothetical protein